MDRSISGAHPSHEEFLAAILGQPHPANTDAFVAAILGDDDRHGTDELVAAILGEHNFDPDEVREDRGDV